MAVVSVVGGKVTLTWKASIDELATLGITLPDGTSASATVTHVAEAQTAVYTPTLPGRHQLLWSTSVDKRPDILDVWPTTPRYLVSIDDAIERLQLSSVKTSMPAALEALPLYIASATMVVESITGALIPDTRTWLVSGRRNQRKVVLPDDDVTVTAVTVDDVDLSSDDWVVEYGSILVSDSLTEGDANILVTYTVGDVTQIPPQARQACLEIVAHMWQATRQGLRAPTGQETEVTPMGFAIPRRAFELLYSLPGLAGIA